MKHICTILLFSFLAYSSIFAQPLMDRLDENVLFAHAAPANNGGSPGWGIFFNLVAGSNFVDVTHMTTASTATAGAGYNVSIFTRHGSALGGPASSGAGSSYDGWDSLGTVAVIQGSSGSAGVSEIFAIPNIHIDPGDTIGVAVRFWGFGPRYYGTGTPPYGVYQDNNLTLITGDARQYPFTPGGSFFTSRELVGAIYYDTTLVPVELSSFTASIRPAGNAVELKWETATEVNNSGFGIERKTETSAWHNVGFVKGNGTTSEDHSYSFLDKNLVPGSYYYRLKQTDMNGTFKFYELADVMEIVTPLSFSLSQNYPNPFNPVTQISWQLQTACHTTLIIYDELGTEVAVLVNEEKPAGTYQLEFDASSLASGMYYYRITAGNFIETKKMILLK